MAPEKASSTMRTMARHDVAEFSTSAQRSKASPAGGARKKTVAFATVFFQLNPPMAEEIPLSWDEIAAR